MDEDNDSSGISNSVNTVSGSSDPTRHLYVRTEELALLGIGVVLGIAWPLATMIFVDMKFSDVIGCLLIGVGVVTVVSTLIHDIHTWADRFMHGQYDVSDTIIEDVSGTQSSSEKEPKVAVSPGRAKLMTVEITYLDERSMKEQRKQVEKKERNTVQR